MTDTQTVEIHECSGRSPDRADDSGAPRILDIDLAIMLATRGLRVVRDGDSLDTCVLAHQQ